MIYGLISAYKEGELLRSCVASAWKGCQVVAIFEGPVGPDAKTEPFDRLVPYQGTHVEYGNWETDAEKRTAMLKWAKRHWEEFLRPDGPGDAWSRATDSQWILWLDGDEILLWGEYLPDLTRRADYETGIGGYPLRLVELDGSVAFAKARLFRADKVTRVLESIYQYELSTGLTVALPNEKICDAGGIPVGFGTEDPETIRTMMGERRPPLAGEPHILHRSLYRDPGRGIRRLHEDEDKFYRGGR